MKTFSAGLLVLLALVGALAYFSLFIVDQTQQAIVLEFGKTKKVIKDPGLKWKIPFVQTVQYFDKRILDLDTPAQEVIASDEKRLVVDSFARYKIVDPLLFFQTVRDERIARSRLGSILDSSLRRVLGTATLQDVVRDKRKDMMITLTNFVNQEAKSFGIEIIDVRIKRADLPAENSQAIYKRMQSERHREAAEFRARGQEEALRIRAEADRQVTILKAEATRDAQKIRGDGDAKRNEIFANAYGKDAGFFAFYRSMQAYENGLLADGTKLVISPDSEFFRYFNNPAGGASRR